MEAGRSCPRPRTPRPSSRFSGFATAPAPVPAAERMLRLHDTSAEPTGFVAGARERAAAQCRQTGKSFDKAVVKAVTAGPPRVHVHLPMHLHMNRAMIRVS